MKENEKHKVDARIINLKKECVWILSKWKWIIGLTILFTICIVAWKYAVDYRSNLIKYQEAIENEKNSSVDYLSEQMTEQQMGAINRAFYCWLQSMGASEYFENSVLMHINPYATNIAYITVNTDDNQVQISEFLGSSEFVIKLREKLGWDIEERYLREMVTVDGNIISIVAMNEQDCILIAENIENMLNERYFDKELQILTETDIIVDTELVDLYNNIYTNWVTNSDRYNAYERQLSISELAVLKAMMLDYLGDDEESQDDTEIILEKTSLNKKMIVVGIFGGMIFSIVLLSVFYTLSPYIHGKEELLALFNLNVFGELDAKSLDVEYLVTNIVLACKKNMVSTVYMSGTKVSELSEDVYKQIEATLQASQFKLIRGEDITKNAKSLTQMVQAGACIIIERDENSKCTVIEDEMNICSRNQVQVLGAILLKA